HMSLTGKFASFDPVEQVDIPLNPQRRWLAVMGSVGQPRDHDPAACYAVLDDERHALTYVRVPYDIESAARKILAAGLPSVLASRLSEGYGADRDVRRLESGQVTDGFTLGRPLDPGGMASFWRVSRAGSDLPMVMKIPLMRRGEDPLTIVGFEVEQMI